MTEILIDTNVLVYIFDLAEIKKRAHAVVVTRELQNRALGCLSVQSLSEFVNATTRGKLPLLTFANASVYVEEFLAAFPVFPLTPTVIMEALRGAREHSISYYDAQIWACAHLNQIPVVFSEDFSDGRLIEGVRFVNPFSETFELEKWL
jgi:predicted nucleic acid-binding protein